MPSSTGPRHETNVVTPFDWQRYGEGRPGATGSAPRSSSKKGARKVLSAAEKAARVLAHRWNNPYCKPGPV